MPRPRRGQGQNEIHSQPRLTEITGWHGLDIEYIIRSSGDDWAHYEAANWKGLIEWLEENPGHSDKQAVIDWLRKTQNDYFQFGREHPGWALYFLNPVRYR